MTTIDGVGPQYPQPDPRGWLVFRGLPNALQNAEDSTAAADFERQRTGRGIVRRYDKAARGWFFERPATDAERALLAHLGYTLPVDLVTRVSYVSETLRRRRWPSLEIN